MAQPSVAREPSMEEILASIRRIIESNDPGLGKDAARSLAPIYGGEEDAMDDEDELSIDDARELSLMLEAANDKAPPAVAAPEIPAAPPVAAPVVDTIMAAGEPRQPAKSISLADLAARVRAAADRNESLMSRPASAIESPVMTGRMAELRNPSAAPMPEAGVSVARAEEPPKPAAPVPAPVATDRQAGYHQVGAEMQEALDHALRQSAPVHAEPSMVVREPVGEPLGMIEDDSARGLLSVVAGQQIARSFDELAAAIDGSQRRSLDEMAEEMLRPMLQEWLDDNLPTLVERLVREEIERVARGPRR